MRRKHGYKLSEFVAVPTASQASLDLISSHADKIYCANIRTGHFFAVAEAYEHWYDLDEDEVQKILGT